MGAAASIQMVYSDAMRWFKQYFDAHLYVEDFQSMDKDDDGGIQFEELQNWLKRKANDEGGETWKMVISNNLVFKVAHKHASRSIHRVGSSDPASSSTEDNAHEEQTDLPLADRVVDVQEFKAFLMHLFALSIMWVHFKSADEWMDGQDVGNETLNFDEFKLACRTFNTAQANAELTNEQIEKDFKLLDTNQNGSVDFLEVCDYCCKFIDPNFADEILKSNPDRHSSVRASVDYGLNPDERNVESEKKRRSNTIHSALNNVRKKEGQGGPDGGDGEAEKDANGNAVGAIASEIDKHKTIAEFEQIKHSTEVALGLV